MSSDDLLHHELALMAMAGDFDLAEKSSRKRSAQLLAGLFLRLQAAIRPKVVLEIGAFEAKFSQQMRKLLPEAELFAFEANPHNHAHFSATTDFAGQHIAYLHSAVSDVDGTLTFHVQTESRGGEVAAVGGSHSLLRRVDASTKYAEHEVPSVRVDSFLAGRKLDGEAFSCWIDVEGAAERVLGSFGASIADCRSMLCEVEEEAKWAGQWTRGQVTRFLFDRGFVPVARDFEWAAQYNILFLRRELLDSFPIRDLLTRHASYVAKEARAAGAARA